MALRCRRVRPCDEKEGREKEREEKRHGGGRRAHRRRRLEARVARVRAFVRDGAGGGDGIDRELGLHRLGWEVG